MPTITIDGEKYLVDGDQNLLSSCLTLGLNVPYFCWHPEMGSVGACRQCAMIEYKDSEDESGRLIMSCMTPVRDGGIYSVKAEAAQEFRGSIIEDLMTNHPHDCPVCEEGGECHLQDMTEMSGHTMRRYRGTKRTHRNQYLGPFINHEMNRCITCYRCIRFYNDYAGGNDLQALGRNHQVYFGREQEGRLQNGFSGNLVEVCPTGVFTDKTFSAHFVRKWDLQTAPSICEHCAVGCNTAPGARESSNSYEPMLRRITNLYHHDINGYFLCDRGRFGYEYVNSAARINHVLSAQEEDLIGSTADSKDQLHRRVSPRDGVLHLSVQITAAQRQLRRIIGIGSPRASLENNYALRQLVGADNFFSGLNRLDHQLVQLVNHIQSDQRITSPNTPQIEAADVVLIIGEDIYNTAPRIALAVRQAARNRQKKQAQNLKIPLWQDASVRQLEGDPNPITFIGTELTELADISATTLFESPDKIALFTQALTREITGSGNQCPDISSELQKEVKHTTQLLLNATNPLIISGISSRSSSILMAAAELAGVLSDHRKMPTKLYLNCGEVNSLGMIQLFNEKEGYLEQLLESLTDSSEDMPTSLIVLENDLYRRLDTPSVEKIFTHVDEVILIDTLLTSTAKRANWIFPASTTAESQGTYVNNNGLAQRFYAVYEGKGFIQESWRWLVDAVDFCTEKSDNLSPLCHWKHSTDLSDAIAKEFKALRILSELGPNEDYRIDGLKVARQSARYSGRTAIHAQQHVSETPPVIDPDAPMSFSMEGIHNPNKTPLQANIWSPGWNSNQSIFKFQQQVGGERKGGPSGKYIERSQQSLHEWNTSDDQSIKPAENDNKLQMLPIYRLFGSEELSNQSMSFSEVIDAPFVLIHPDVITQYTTQEGELVDIETNCGVYRAELKSCISIPNGCIGIPFGLPGLETLAPQIPGYAALRPAVTPAISEGQ
ncbi:NADH-quinone oxidoreductase subunit NuoG [Microbulbifer sp. THAF38]|uniref:NADH-quinone oxidoreductase subunit NuoG n=1 Tax=Microbulbifer sp. THAF38 TaxID=2587856 RepID=UPI001269116B|nr:NADH-quinone oxidoreductase subunit NuoG [Microbulbifer sp. THAF38]QFT53899.1 NADH-quinone oxidoreductase subunit G [Microbulbifer sp. THAF38]